MDPSLENISQVSVPSVMKTVSADQSWKRRSAKISQGQVPFTLLKAPTKFIIGRWFS